MFLKDFPKRISTIYHVINNFELGAINTSYTNILAQIVNMISLSPSEMRLKDLRIQIKVETYNMLHFC